MVLETPDDIKGKEFILVGPSGGHIDLKEVAKQMKYCEQNVQEKKKKISLHNNIHKYLEEKKRKQVML